MSGPVALLDANVLYPARLRDLLIRLDIAGLYRARWSEQILDECFENLTADRPDIAEYRLTRTRRLMNTALPGAIVEGYETLVDAQDLPDAGDRHVLAAAIHARASHLVTNNLADFPSDRTQGELLIVSPDSFVTGLAEHEIETVVQVVETQAGQLDRPAMTTVELLDGLRDVGLIRFAHRVRAVVE
ncbi:MAG: PIN domain-containing protein [Dermatophilaceae bacterium]